MWAEKSLIFVDVVWTTKSTKIINPQKFLALQYLLVVKISHSVIMERETGK